MRIIVCVKQVPEAQNAKLDKETNSLIRRNIRMVTNPADVSALMMADRLKTAWNAELVVLSMGPAAAADSLRRTVARWADSIFLASDPAFSGADSYATAHVLHRVVDYLGGADLLLCGRRATDGETGQVGPELAVMLGVPCATGASDITPDEMGIVCTRALEHGMETLVLPLPALVTVCEQVADPPAPSLAQLRRAKGVKLVTLSRAELGIPTEEAGIAGSKTQVIRIYSPPADNRKRMMAASIEEGARAVAQKILESPKGL